MRLGQPGRREGRAPRMKPSVRLAVFLACVSLFSTPASAASERSFKKTVFEAEKEKSLELGGEIRHEYKIELKPTLVGPECQARVSISYVPMYDKVRVETTVEHDGCAASSGDYHAASPHPGTPTAKSRHRTSRSHGAVRTRSAVDHTKVYPLDPERELVWVRVRTERKTNCRCDAVDEPRAIP